MRELLRLLLGLAMAAVSLIALATFGVPGKLLAILWLLWGLGVLFALILALGEWNKRR